MTIMTIVIYNDYNEFNILSLVWSVLLLASVKVVSERVRLPFLGSILPGRKIFAPLRGTGSKQLFRDGEVVDISKGSLRGR